MSHSLRERATARLRLEIPKHVQELGQSTPQSSNYLNGLVLITHLMLAWSTHCSGRKYAEPKPKTPKRIARRGTARVVVDALNVRNSYSTSSKVVAV